MSAPIVSVAAYPVRLDIDYPDRPLNRVTSAFRVVLVLPMLVLLALLPTGLLTAPVGVMLLVRRKYPKWWFEWQVQLQRFESRVCAYALLLDDRYHRPTRIRASTSTSTTPRHLATSTVCCRW